jgi:hypothetical protein
MLCTALGVLAEAQTMTNANGSPVPGDTFLQLIGPGPALGGGGAGVVWDMSTLQAQDTFLTVYESPVGTTWSDHFPSATVARVTVNGLVYYEASGEGFDQLGSGSTTGVDSCWNPRRVMSYPLSFEDSWSDDFDCIWDSANFNFGSLSCTVDGYGTLIMPYGTLENVLRRTCTGSSAFVTGTDTVASPPAQAISFLKPGVHRELLTVYEGLTNASWLDDLSTGLDEAIQHPIGIALSPNPGTYMMCLEYSCTAAHMFARITDASGRVVMERSLGGPVGIRRENIDISTLSSGLYALHISDGIGGWGAKRFMVR